MSTDQPAPSDTGFTPVEKLDGLSPRQKQEVRSKNRPNAALIHETIRSEGIGELERSAWALALSGLSAGLSIGFSLVVQGILHATIPPGPTQELVSPLGYTIGFLIVVLGRQQLFTENTLTPVLPLLHDRSARTFVRLARLWLVVLTFNIVGTLIFAWVIAKAGIFEANVLQAFTDLGRETIKADFGVTSLRAIFAGWLIALMVWLLPGAESARTLIIVILTYVIALSGFSHIIAGSAECAFLVDVGQATWSDYAERFFLPTLLGNIAGGVTLVAALNYGQVMPEIEGTE